MNLTSFRHRSLIAIGVVALVAGSVVGCAPGPEPTPTPTSAFASEEEAFAAAEEVYWAYLEASALRASGDSNATPEDLLTGTALETDASTQQMLEEQGLRIVGTSTIAEFVPIEADIEATVAKISAEICVDISGSRVLDETGADVTPVTRANKANVAVEFTGNNASLLISSTEAPEDSAC